LADGDPSNGVPTRITLAQNYPNPFNPTTVIAYELRQSERVRLDVFDVSGRHLATLVDAHQPAGTVRVSFDARLLGSGFYLYRLEAGATIETRRMMLIR